MSNTFFYQKIKSYIDGNICLESLGFKVFNFLCKSRCNLSSLGYSPSKACFIYEEPEWKKQDLQRLTTEI